MHLPVTNSASFYFLSRIPRYSRCLVTTNFQTLDNSVNPDRKIVMLPPALEFDYDPDQNGTLPYGSVIVRKKSSENSGDLFPKWYGFIAPPFRCTLTISQLIVKLLEFKFLICPTLFSWGSLNKRTRP